MEFLHCLDIHEFIDSKLTYVYTLFESDSRKSMIIIVISIMASSPNRPHKHSFNDGTIVTADTMKISSHGVSVTNSVLQINLMSNQKTPFNKRPFLNYANSASIQFNAVDEGTFIVLDANVDTIFYSKAVLVMAHASSQQSLVKYFPRYWTN